MKIVVMGTGGTGGYYGGLLARDGHEVTFIARGDNLLAIQKNGLRVWSTHGDFVISPAPATNDPSTIAIPELILFCTKTYDTDDAVHEILPIIGLNTTILSLQNGIDAVERIGKVVGNKHMVAGATWISSALESPGVIRHVSEFRRVVIGEVNGTVTPRLNAIFEIFKATGITAEISQDILKVLWTKFIFISAASSFGSITGLPIGGYRSIPETRVFIVRLMREVEAVARAQNIDLDLDIVEQSLAFMDKNGPEIRASMQLDVAGGHPSEIESILGVIGRQGRNLGIKTPVADMLYGLLLPADLKARNKLSSTA